VSLNNHYTNDAIYREKTGEVAAAWDVQHSLTGGPVWQWRCFHSLTAPGRLDRFCIRGASGKSQYHWGAEAQFLEVKADLANISSTPSAWFKIRALVPTRPLPLRPRLKIPVALSRCPQAPHDLPPRFSSHPLRSPRRPTPKTLTLAHPRPRAQATAPGHGRRRHAPLAGGRVPGLPRAPCRHDQGAHHRYVPPLPPSISPPLRRWILNGFGGSWGSGAFDRWVPGWLIWFILLEFFWQTWRSSTSSATQVSSRLAPPIRCTWVSNSCDSVAVVPEWLGLGGGWLGEVLVISVLVTGRGNLFVWILVLVWGSLLLTSIYPGFCWIFSSTLMVWEIWPVRESFCAFYLLGKRFDGNSLLGPVLPAFDLLAD
jgi:hypothetical protein